MLHRVLSVTTVEVLCCHNATLHILRDELTCGNCQLYTWRLNLSHALSFNSSLQNMLVITFTEAIIIQSEHQNQDKNQVSEKKFQNLGDFEFKISNASDTETNFPQRVRF